MKDLSPGQLVLRPFMFLAATWFVATVAANLVYTNRAHLNPAIVFRNVELVASVAQPGQSVVVSYFYDKRPDCYPPKGFGEFYYRIYFKDVDGAYRHFVQVEAGLASLEEPGIGRHALNEVRMPALPVGEYQLQLRAMFQCKGEQQPQIITPPPLPLTIAAA